MNDITSDFEDKIFDLKSFEIDYYDMREYADDIDLIRRSLHTVGIFTSHIIAYNFWIWYSLRLDAGWLTCSSGEVVTVYGEFMKYGG